ncbi:adhesion G protein-coupled receptor B3-like [Ruditapes philippinarum]|uniref:adhesion G protein-coupled receptor B3-like n=1 Tax=Ruditapes philippinarum TaxID=129788 RepID=UPI00295B03A9|nr:adhesion G protein-coupled receptor B3-like [Ruditapes philippinarum]
MYLKTRIMFVLILRECLCDKIKIFQTNGRIADVSDSKVVRSLLECSVLYKNTVHSLSFNYNKDTKMCELSNNYPEGSTISASGWNVYAHIVNGGWSTWHSWSPCSVTCTDGTRTRSRSCSNPSPSNGGQTCQGPTTENEVCNERDCFLASDYFISSGSMTRQEAAATCSSIGARLVILESQEEIDFLQTQVSEFYHWIGMTCSAGTNCVWDDGKSVNSGFTAWAPNEPQGHDCVYIGYYVNKWDDGRCVGPAKALCEYI